MKKYEEFIQSPEIDINEYIEEHLIRTKSDYKTIIDDLEKAIRSMPEYKLWSIRHKVGVTNCQICKIKFNKKIKPEVHHTPLTLYEIVQAVITEKINMGEQITTIDIIKQVIDWHINEKVGALTLCTCCHKQAHYEREEFGEEVTINSVLAKKNSEDGCSSAEQ